MNVPNPPATFGQRKAIYNMRQALRMSVSGIRDMRFNEASREVARLKKIIAREGFPAREPDLNPDGMADYINTEAGNG